MYTLLATGDLMLQRPLVRAEAVGLTVFESFRAADHAFVNLEVALTMQRGALDKLVCLRADPSLAGSLVQAGIKVVTVANNHAVDFGLDGLYETLSALDAVGLPCVGAGRDLASARRPAILTAGELRVAFLGLACTLPNGCGAGPDRGGVAPVRVVSRFVVDPVTIDEDPGMSPFVETVVMPGDVEQAAEAVRQAKEMADLVIVGIHWGVPHGWVAQFQGELATYQRPLAHTLIDAGADAVVGHHPHVLHGIEVYRARPIFYSLGNFLFHSFSQGRPHLARTYPTYLWHSLRGEVNRCGGIACVAWHDPQDGPTRVELWPVWLDDAGEPAFPGAERARAAIARVAEQSQEFGTSIRLAETPRGIVGVIGCSAEASV